LLGVETVVLMLNNKKKASQGLILLGLPGLHSNWPELFKHEADRIRNNTYQN